MNIRRIGKVPNIVTSPHTGIYFGVVGSGASGYDWVGDGSDGALTVSGDTTLSSSSNTKNYTTLVINSGVNLYCGSVNDSPVPWVIYASESITVNGTLNLDGRGANGGNAVSYTHLTLPTTPYV